MLLSKAYFAIETFLGGNLLLDFLSGSILLHTTWFQAPCIHPKMKIFLLLLQRGEGDDFSLFMLQNLHGVFLYLNSVWSAKIKFYQIKTEKRLQITLIYLLHFSLCALKLDLSDSTIVHLAVCQVARKLPTDVCIFKLNFITSSSFTCTN